MNNFINFFQELLNMPEEDKISSPTSIGNLISLLGVSIQEKFWVMPMEICYPKRMKNIRFLNHSKEVQKQELEEICTLYLLLILLSMVAEVIFLSETKENLLRKTK